MVAFEEFRKHFRACFWLKQHAKSPLPPPHLHLPRYFPSSFLCISDQREGHENPAITPIFRSSLTGGTAPVYVLYRRAATALNAPFERLTLNKHMSEHQVTVFKGEKSYEKHTSREHEVLRIHKKIPCCGVLASHVGMIKKWSRKCDRCTHRARKTSKNAKQRKKIVK